MNDLHWELLAAAVPDDLAGCRVLDLGPASRPDRVADELAQRSPAELSRPATPAEPGAWGGGYDFVICRELLQRNVHPARLLCAIWEATTPSGTLLLHSRVIDEIEKSPYASFADASATHGSTEWLPGRLALRWSVETSGFDVERWLADAEGPERGTAEAALVAIRTDRYPSLILATPSRPEEADR